MPIIQLIYSNSSRNKPNRQVVSNEDFNASHEVKTAREMSEKVFRDVNSSSLTLANVSVRSRTPPRSVFKSSMLAARLPCQISVRRVSTLFALKVRGITCQAVAAFHLR
jgi:cell division protein FtsI/penicillin-binding protein 2